MIKIKKESSVLFLVLVIITLLIIFVAIYIYFDTFKPVKPPEPVSIKILTPPKAVAKPKPVIKVEEKPVVINSFLRDR